MSDETKREPTRQKRWQKYFETEEDGKTILQCITLKIPSWKNSATAATQVGHAYAFSSQYAHSTAFDIANGADSGKEYVILLDEVTTNIQLFQAINCIAEGLDLKIGKP